MQYLLQNAKDLAQIVLVLAILAALSRFESFDFAECQFSYLLQTTKNVTVSQRHQPQKKLSLVPGFF